MKAICSKFPKTILVLGPPGSGKDTQMDKLVELCGYEKIGTGDMFREEYEKGTERGLEAYKYWGEGKWVPDDLTYTVFGEWILKFDMNKPWIFSQVVRAPGQIALLDRLLEKFERKLELVVHFTLSEEKAIERMSLRRHCPKCEREYHLKYVPPKNDGKCDDDGEDLVSREDDEPGAIRMRLSEYHEKVLPVVEMYQKRGILVEIDAGPSIEEIWTEVQKVLEKSAGAGL